jgi:hypothetical protein
VCEQLWNGCFDALIRPRWRSSARAETCLSIWLRFLILPPDSHVTCGVAAPHNHTHIDTRNHRNSCKAAVRRICVCASDKPDMLLMLFGALGWCGRGFCDAGVVNDISYHGRSSTTSVQRSQRLASFQVKFSPRDNQRFEVRSKFEHQVDSRLLNEAKGGVEHSYTTNVYVSGGG